MIRLRLLGGIDLRDPDGREVRPVLAQPKRLALLAYLAAATPRGAHRRDALVGLFWPELDQDHARNALSKALHFLRRSLGDTVLISRGAEDLALDPELVWCDAAAFGTALDEGRAEEALWLYHGDLLPSFFVPDAPGFEDWLDRERAGLRDRAAGAARQLADRHEREQQPTLAVAFARRAIELSNGDERPFRRLIALLDRLGDHAAALRAYDEFSRRLAIDLEIEPAEETVALVGRIREEERQRAAATTVSTVPRPPTAETSDAAVRRLGAALADHYEVGPQIGAGAMAVVVRATDLRHHRPVAIKVLRPELASVTGPDRFVREIDIAAGLVHPHILPLHDSGERDGVLYYVMPYIDGRSLRDRLDGGQRLPVAEAVRITREAADALDYAHAQGFVHRDIKPENILLSRGHALVADFGIARVIGGAGESGEAASAATGTPAYMSPEQVLGDAPLDGRTDIYALGCVLYEMLAGRRPFDGASADAVLAGRLSGPAPPVSRWREEVTPELDAAVGRALARHADDRFPRAAEFAEALAAAEAPMPSPRTGLPAAASRPAGARPWRILAAVLAIAALAVSGMVRWGRPVGSAAAEGSPSVVAVLPFRVDGADPRLRYLRHGMMDLLAARFTGEGGPRAADVRSVLSALAGRGDTADADLPAGLAARVARRVGAGLVLEGNVVGRPERLVLTASLSSARGPAKTATVQGPADSLLPLVDRLAVGLLARDAGLGPQQLASLTPSLDALRAFLDGQAAYRRGAYQEAIRRFDDAIQIDSSFALAAAGLVKSDGWAGYPHGPAVARLAWRHRHRLSERDQVLLTLRLGPRYPHWAPAAMQIAAAERATRMIPESPEPWFELGDRLFHMAELAGIPDGRSRAELMFRNALARDSLYAPALGHLVSLVALRGDTAELGRLVPRLLAIDTTGWPSFAARWRLAVARRDSLAIARFIEGLDDHAPYDILNFARDELGDSIGVSYLPAFLDGTRARVTTGPERAIYAWDAWNAAVNGGRPAEARQWVDALRPDRRRFLPVLGWLAGVDTAGMGAAERQEAHLAESGAEARLAASNATEDGYPSALFLVEASKLYRGDVSSVGRSVARLRRDPVLRDSISDSHLVSAQVLEAWSAVIRRAPEARRLLDTADSMLVGRGGLMTAEGFNWLVAHLYGRIGATDRALRAIRRRPYMSTFPWPAGLAESSRLEGRWAAALGDNAGAVAAYRRYLVMRRDPDAVRALQRDSVRAELAAVERPDQIMERRQTAH
jgi:eukaryotic-like serine/threonine-protein kinase